MLTEECYLTHAPVLTSRLVETATILTNGKPVFNNNQPLFCEITITPHNKRNISKTNIYFNHNPLNMIEGGNFSKPEMVQGYQQLVRRFTIVWY